jgi:hypothetical protein
MEERREGEGVHCRSDLWRGGATGVDVVSFLEVSGGNGGADEMQKVTARSGEVCLSMFASCNAAEMQPELGAGDEVCRADRNSTVERVFGHAVLTRSRGSSMRAWWRSR